MNKRLKNIQTFEQHSSELNISDVSDSNLFLAEEGEVKLEIEESFLIERNINLLLRKLRRKGFSNLTGNFERKEIIKHDDGKIEQVATGRNIFDNHAFSY
jgi:hypothetical protein